MDNFLMSCAPLREEKEGKFSLIYTHPESSVDKKEIGKLL